MFTNKRYADLSENVCDMYTGYGYYICNFRWDYICDCIGYYSEKDDRTDRRDD